MKKIFKYSFHLFFLLSMTIGFSQNHSSNYFIKLKGSVKIIHAYNGGAEPAREILDEFSKPVAFVNRQLFLKKTYYSELNYVIQTDSAGNFDLDIKPGVYNIYFSNENVSEKKMIDSTDV